MLPGHSGGGDRGRVWLQAVLGVSDRDLRIDDARVQTPVAKRHVNGVSRGPS